MALSLNFTLCKIVMNNINLNKVVIMKKFMIHFPIIISISWAFAKPKYGPLEKPKATTLSQNHDYLKHAEKTDFWNLVEHYRGMEGDHSASAASVAMAFNALRGNPSKLTGSDENFSENTLLNVDSQHRWKKSISGKSPKNVTLKDLQNYAQEAAQKLLSHAQLTFELMESSQIKKWNESEWMSFLEKNETNPQSIVIAFYLQGAHTDDPEGMVGTFSPIGAFNSKLKQVLIMETDRKYYAPYWISLNTFQNAILELETKSTKKGQNGGLLVISF